MYKFIDVNEVSEGALLPSEALSFNGEYIENLISGYRTLNVSGREALSPEIETIETGVRDGSSIKSKRYPARTIVVQYQLIAESNEAFREAYNKLGQILNVSDAEMIFADEPDKFYKGTPISIGEVEPGKNAVVGEIEFLCVDPFKYSVVEYEATASPEDASTILVNYNGTYKSYPTLQADFFKESEIAEDGETATPLTGSGDCGFVAFFNENENIIQLGNPEEIDIDTSESASQTLMSQNFLTNTSWGTASQKLWEINAATGLVDEMEQVGTIGTAVAIYESAPSADTVGMLINTTSKANEDIHVNYAVSAKATERTSDSVKVNIAITGTLGLDSSELNKGVVLLASVFIAGYWNSVILKKATEIWEGRTGHTVNLSVTITGLTDETDVLSGIKFKVTREDTNGDTGTIAESDCNDLEIVTFAEGLAESYYLKATSYGSVYNKWHGATITRTLPADKTGEVGAKNFLLSYKQRMCIANSITGKLQCGAFQVHCLDEKGASIVGVRICKNKAGQNAEMSYYINGEKVHDVTVGLGYNNIYYGASESKVNAAYIRKTGNQIVFNIGVSRQVFTSNSYSGLKVTKVVFAFEQYGVTPALAYNGLYWAKFTKHEDVENSFTANDVVKADCRSGEILLNNVSTPSLGALGNDWEEFFLIPGINQIGTAYSSWVGDAYAPTFKVRYREVFL